MRSKTRHDSRTGAEHLALACTRSDGVEFVNSTTSASQRTIVQIIPAAPAVCQITTDRSLAAWLVTTLLIFLIANDRVFTAGPRRAIENNRRRRTPHGCRAGRLLLAADRTTDRRDNIAPSADAAARDEYRQRCGSSVYATRPTRAISYYWDAFSFRNLPLATSEPSRVQVAISATSMRNGIECRRHENGKT